MRFSSAYYLMLIYLTVMFKPIIPVIRDIYAHTFGEAIHLASIHAKYGSHHLDKALSETGDNNNAQKSISTGETYIVYLVSAAFNYHFHLDKIELNYFFRRCNKLLMISPDKVVPPPRAL